MSVNRNNWNLTERKELLTLIKAGKSLMEISSKLNRTKSAVQTKIYNLAKENIIRIEGTGRATKYVLIPLTASPIVVTNTKDTNKTNKPLVKAPAQPIVVREYKGGHLVYNNRLYKEVV